MLCLFLQFDITCVDFYVDYDFECTVSQKNGLRAPSVQGDVSHLHLLQ